MENKIINGDALTILKNIPDESIDAIVCDPPYELGFMGKKWDASGIAYNVDLWKECLRVLKPGGHLLAFGGTRTYHRMACAIEDARFEVRDMIEWIYASGFPKSLNVGKAVDKLQGNERIKTGKILHHAQKGVAIAEERGAIGAGAFGEARTEEETKGNSKWEGFGTALKPSHEPIILCRKPLAKVYLYELFEMYGFNFYITTSTATEGTKRYQSYIEKGFEPVIENIEEIRERITAQVEKKYEDDEDGLIDYEQEIEDKIQKATPKKVFRFETKLATNPSVESIWTIETTKGKETIKTEKYKKIWKDNNVVNCLKYGTGAIDIDSCRIPTSSQDKDAIDKKNKSFKNANNKEYQGIQFVNKNRNLESNSIGRFPANCICTDDALNDGVMTKSGSSGKGSSTKVGGIFGSGKPVTSPFMPASEGSKSRYFDIECWWKKQQEELDFACSKAYNREKNNLTQIIWETKTAVVEKSKLVKSNSPAIIVVEYLLTMPAIEWKDIISALKLVMLNSDFQNQNRLVKYAEDQLVCNETDFAQKLAQIKQDMETFNTHLNSLEQKTKQTNSDITTDKSTEFQKSVRYAVELIEELLDIIQTISSQEKLFGFVHNAIFTQMRQDMKDDPLSQNLEQLPPIIKAKFPILFCAKASKRERNEGCEGLEMEDNLDKTRKDLTAIGCNNPANRGGQIRKGNIHPTCKPVHLMSWLVRLVSKEGDTVLDPFCGSGTTGVACKKLGRNFIGIELNEEYIKIAEARINGCKSQLQLNL